MIKKTFSLVKSFFGRVGKEEQGRRRAIRIVSIAFFLVLGLYLIFGGKEGRRLVTNAQRITDKEIKDVGMFTGTVETESWIQRKEKDFLELQEKEKETISKVESVEYQLKEMIKTQGDIKEAILKLEKLSKERSDEKAAKERPDYLGSLQKGLVEGLQDLAGLDTKMELKTVELTEINEKKIGGKNVYLPLGSFCQGKLLTGVYAPSDEANPLPVLIELTEAFYGPNKARIPLEGAFAIGKATGNLVSQRAIVQIVAISTVHANGETFEHEGNLGYLTDSAGQLGIPGRVVYNTGKELAMNFLSGFMSGVGEAFAEKETTEIVGSEGQTRKVVTGSDMKYGLFSGLTQSAGSVSEYYRKRLEGMVPAVEVDADREVFFIIQKGVEIEGLKVAAESGFSYLD